MAFHASSHIASASVGRTARRRASQLTGSVESPSFEDSSYWAVLPERIDRKFRLYFSPGLKTPPPGRSGATVRICKKVRPSSVSPSSQTGWVAAPSKTRIAAGMSASPPLVYSIWALKDRPTRTISGSRRRASSRPPPPVMMVKAASNCRGCPSCSTITSHTPGVWSLRSNVANADVESTISSGSAVMSGAPPVGCSRAISPSAN